MSVVTVQSDGHVDVDWESQVPCPECGEDISTLIARFPDEEECYIDDGDLIYEPEYNFGEARPTDYYCPVCDKLLFNKEDDAKRFLLSLTWEPDLLPMPL